MYQWLSIEDGAYLVPIEGTFDHEPRIWEFPTWEYAIETCDEECDEELLEYTWHDFDEYGSIETMEFYLCEVSTPMTETFEWPGSQDGDEEAVIKTYYPEIIQIWSEYNLVEVRNPNLDLRSVVAMQNAFATGKLEINDLNTGALEL